MRDSKKHVLHGIEARKWVFQGRPPKKWPFFAQKWSKNVNIVPETLFFWLGRSVQGPPTLFCRCLTRKNIGCMVRNRKIGISGAPQPKKLPFFAQKWPTIANFRQKGSVFGLGCSVQGPPTLFFWCWTQKNMCCMVLKPGIGCFKACRPKKWAFFAQKWPKMPILGLKTCFFGLGRSVEGTPTLFCRCLITKISCMEWKPKNRCFSAAPPKKWPFLGQKWPKSANFGQKSSVLGLGCSVQDPRTLFF